MHNQPFLHDLVTALAAPATVLSARDGQLRRDGAQGWLVADVRHLAELVVTVDGREPVALGHRQESPATLSFTAAARHLGDELTEPTVRVDRRRHTAPDTLRETITLSNDSRREITTTVNVRLAADLAPILAFRGGARPDPVPPRAPKSGVAEWVTGGRVTTLTTDRAPDEVTLTDQAHLDWHLTVPPRTRVTWTLTLTATSATDDQVFTAPATTRTEATLTSANKDLAALFHTGLADLDHLLLADAAAPSDLFAAAGAPWYLTLFGRDSLWTARFALPLGTDLAMGTLRTLARRQGTHRDPETEEEPGRIPHEIRRVPSDVDTELGLPPCYYGTIDATPLWISLMHDAWRWGADVEELLDPMRRALTWVLSHEDFLSYRDVLGRGLKNQGWKDSADSIQDREGNLAAAPVALSEAQAYAHRAALDAATLLDAHGQPGADEARTWAARLNARFRSSFWVRDAEGPYPALALDAHGRPADALASNMGHLLGSGLLTAAESALVAARLGSNRLSSGYGLRTFDGEHPYFNPIGYHTGSVWPHDTAIAVAGLAGDGHPGVAAALAEGVVRAGAHFDHRLPELYGGWAEADGPLLDYPSTCRPQAWSAASVLALVWAALGLTPNARTGELSVHPSAAFASWFPLTIDGVTVAGTRHRISIDAGGTAKLTRP
jgi:glycogen debranching enzyme